MHSQYDLGETALERCFLQRLRPWIRFLGDVRCSRKRRQAMNKKEKGLELFAQACTHHQKGEHKEAEDLYIQAVEVDPELVDAWRNLGAMLRQLGRAEEGLSYQRQSSLSTT